MKSNIIQFINMKKIILGLIIFASCFTIKAFSQLTTAEEKIVTDFINSKDFKENGLIKNLNLSEIKKKVSYVNKDNSKPTITIGIFNKGILTGSIEAFKKQSEYLLPNGNAYFMIYREFSDVDLKSKSGKIILYDLNYNNHKFLELYYTNEQNTKYRYIDKPKEIFDEYQDIIEYNSRRHPADLNNNGDISFSECYRYMNVACQTDSGCYTACYGWGDVVGWVWYGFPFCQGAIGAACVFISIRS